MARVTKSRVVKASAQQVWNVIGNYTNIHVFHPFVKDVDQLSEGAYGLGASRQCNLYNQSSIVETVTHWEEGRSYTVQTGDQPMFGVTTGTMSVHFIDATTSKVTVDTTYTPKWGVLGKILDLLVLRMGVSYALSRVLKSLQHYMETGELVGKGGKPISLSAPSVHPTK